MTDALSQAQLWANLGACLPGMAYRCHMDDLWTMIFVSEGSLALTGYSPEALVGNRQVTMVSLIHPEDVDRVRQVVEAALERKDQFTVEYRLIHADGHPRWMWERGVPVRDEHGQIIALDGFIMDITARKRAEAHLVISQKMDALGRMAAGVSHDFSNLLTVIQSYAVGALADCPSGSSLHEDLSQILAAANHAAQLARSLMSLRQREPEGKRVIALEELLATYEEILRRLMGEGVEVVVHPSARAHHVLAQRSQLEQVLLNLALNARDAMPEGGRLELEVRHEVIVPGQPAPLGASLPAGEYAALLVRDTGHGVPPELLGRVFEPFFTTRAADRGSGLGLATVYYVVTNHRGQVLLHSEVGQGTQVHVLLPLVREDEVAARGSALEDVPL